jgi:propionyl-CoA carboxylase alpha chain
VETTLPFGKFVFEHEAFWEFWHPFREKYYSADLLKTNWRKKLKLLLWFLNNILKIKK